MFRQIFIYIIVLFLGVLPVYAQKRQQHTENKKELFGAIAGSVYAQMNDQPFTGFLKYAHIRIETATDTIESD